MSCTDVSRSEENRARSEAACHRSKLCKMAEHRGPMALPRERRAARLRRLPGSSAGPAMAPITAGILAWAAEARAQDDRARRRRSVARNNARPLASPATCPSRRCPASSGSLCRPCGPGSSATASPRAIGARQAPQVHAVRTAHPAPDARRDRPRKQSQSRGRRRARAARDHRPGGRAHRRGPGRIQAFRPCGRRERWTRRRRPSASGPAWTTSCCPRCNRSGCGGRPVVAPSRTST